MVYTHEECIPGEVQGAPAIPNICGGSSPHKNVNVYLETQSPSVWYKDSFYLLCLNELFIIILYKCVVVVGTEIRSLYEWPDMGVGN